MKIWSQLKPKEHASQRLWKVFRWSCQPLSDTFCKLNFPGKVLKVCHAHALSVVCPDGNASRCSLWQSHSYGWMWCLVLFPQGNENTDLSVHLPDGLSIWPLKQHSVLLHTPFMDRKSCFSVADKAGADLRPVMLSVGERLKPKFSDLWAILQLWAELLHGQFCKCMGSSLWSASSPTDGNMLPFLCCFAAGVLKAPGP